MVPPYRVQDVFTDLACLLYCLLDHTIYGDQHILQEFFSILYTTKINLVNCLVTVACDYANSKNAEVVTILMRIRWIVQPSVILFQH